MSVNIEQAIDNAANSIDRASGTHPTEEIKARSLVSIANSLLAIAATLGAGTCKDVCASVSEFTCSVCGFNCDLTSWISLFDGDDGRHRHHHHGTPNYCPNCGRKVEG